MVLSNKLNGFDEGMEVYRHLNSSEDDILIPFSISLWVTGSKIVSLLREHIGDIERNEVRMVFDTDYLQKTDKDYWMKGDKLKRDMEALNIMTLKERGIEYAYKGYKVETTLDIFHKIEENVGQIVELVKVVGQKMDEAPDSLYGNFYRYQRSLCDARRVEADYLRWKRDVAAITFDLLKDRQTFVVAEFLKKKILRFTQIPSDRERELVDLDKVRPHLPHGFELPEEFRNCCARFRRFISWDGDILKINYDCYGKYLFQFFYDLTAEERQALIDLDLMLDLIHQDMQQLTKLRITREAMVMAVEQTVAQGYWWASTAWAVVYRVYQINGYAGSISQFVREVEKWPMQKDPKFSCTYDAVQKTIASGKLARTVDKWIEDGATTQMQKLGQVLLDLLN